jgi:hypothetical protein
MPPEGSLAAYSASLKKDAPPPAEERRDDVEVFVPATGKTTWVPPQEAEQAFVQGEINLPNVHEIAVEMPGGQTGTVDPEHISQALADGGHLISHRQEHDASLAKEYGGAKGGLIAGAAGFGSGLTFGATDAAVGAPDPYGFDEGGTAEAIRASGELHPYIRTAGEVGGMALGSVVAPGAGLASGAEHIAEGALAHASGGALVRGAEGVGARALAKGVGAAAHGAVGGSLVGLQQTLSEAALHEDGNANLTGEKIIAGMGHGAFVGAFAGGLSGGALEGISTGIRAGSKAAAPALERAANREMWRDLNSAKKLTKQVTSRVNGGIEAIGATARAEGLDSPLLSVEQQWQKAADARERVGSSIQDTFRQSGATGRPKELLSKLDGVIAEVDKKAGFENVAHQLRSYKDSLESRLFQGLEKGETFMSPQEAQMAALEKELIANGAAEHRIREVRAIRDELVGKRYADAREAGVAAMADHEVPLDELWKQRKNLDELLRWDGKDPVMGSKVDELRKFRGEFSDFLLSEGERSSKGFSDQVKLLNKQYQHLSIIDDLLEEKVARNLTNRRASLTDSIAQGHGNVGAATMLAAGHPFGAALSLASGAVNHAVREKGPRLAAFLMGRVGGLEDVAAHIGEVDLKVQKAVTAFVDRPERSSGVFERAPEAKASRAVAENDDGVEDRYMLKSAAIKNAAEHPELAQGVDDRLASVAQHAPDAAKAAAGTAKKVLAYLAAELPATTRLDPLRPNELTPPPHAEMDRWLRKERAVDNPGAVFSDLAAGRIDEIAFQAVKANYPELAAKFQQSVLAALADTSRAIDHQERLQLATVLDVPTTPSVAPESIAMRQATFAQAAAGGEDGGKPQGRRSGGKNLDAWSALTPSQELEKGD